MSKSEFILLIPGIIYGVAMVDLLKIFRHKNTYWEIIAWGIAMFLNLIVSWFGLYDRLETISSNIVFFSVYLLSPLLFAQAVFVLTPEENDTETKEYFLSNQRTFFILYLGFVITNLLLSFFITENTALQYMRAIAIAPFILVIIWPKKWLRVLLLIMYYIFALIIYAESLSV